MIWLKAFHVVFVVTWFAGLFYLPRLFVYDVAAGDAAYAAQLRLMQRRLFAIMSIGGALAVLLGLSLVLLAPGYLQFGWLRLKLGCVAALIGYHIWCYRLMRALAQGRARHSARWYRLFNEVPGLLLIAIVLLAVVKPF